MPVPPGFVTRHAHSPRRTAHLPNVGAIRTKLKRCDAHFADSDVAVTGKGAALESDAVAGAVNPAARDATGAAGEWSGHSREWRLHSRAERHASEAVVDAAEAAARAAGAQNVGQWVNRGLETIASVIVGRASRR